MTNLQHIPGQFVNVDGMQVEVDALRIAEAIKLYDPNLEVLCVDPNRAADISEAPFVIAEHCKDGILRPLFNCWTLDNSVLERIRNSDTNIVNTSTSIDDMKAILLKERNRRYAEEREEQKDIVSHIAGIKSKYTVRDSRTGELITFYDDRPATRK